MSAFQSLDSRYPMFPNHRGFASQSEQKAQQKPSDAKTPAKPKIFTYSSIFNKVLLKRLKFYGRLSGLLSLVISIILTIFMRGSVLWIPVKTTIIWLGFIIFRFTRDITIKVESSSYQTPFLALIGQVLSSEFLTYLFAFCASSICYYTVILYQFESFTYYITSRTVTVKPIVDDSYIYYWYFVFASASIYSLRYVLLEKNKIEFKYGVYRLPQEIAMRELNYRSILKDNFVFNGVLFFILPISYLLSRGFIYNFILYPLFVFTNLNRRIPAFKFSLFFYISLFAESFVLTTCWELLNEIYNIYVRIGCISSGKPLSHYSEDPVYTLLSGLRDIKNPIVRLTAFQELAFLSSSTDSNHRKIFYSGTFKGSSVWYIILEECSHVIKSSCMAITSDLHLKPSEKGPPYSSRPSTINSGSLFGNSGPASSNIFNDNNNNDDYVSHSVKMESKKIEDPLTLLLKNPERLKKQNDKQTDQSGESELSKLLKSFKIPQIVDRLIKSTNPSRERLALLQRKLAGNKYGSFFVSDVKREANRRLINPTNLGNSMITITEVLLHAQIEDKNVNINHTSLAQVLILLTKVYKSSIEFLNNPPVIEGQESQNEKAKKEQEQNCIFKIHELSLVCFFELVVSYNPVLNDLILPTDVFDLASWCVNVAIEDQKIKEGSLQ